MKNPVKLNLVGIDGNAFSIMGAFKRQAIKDGWSQEEVKELLHDCMQKDYDGLLCTIMEHCNVDDEDDEEYDEYDEQEEDEYDEEECEN